MFGMCISYIHSTAGRTASEDRSKCQWAVIAIAIARPSRVFSSIPSESKTRFSFLVSYNRAARSLAWEGTQKKTKKVMEIVI